MKASVTFTLGEWTGDCGWRGKQWHPCGPAIRVRIPFEPEEEKKYKWHIWEPANSCSVGHGEEDDFETAKNAAQSALEIWIKNKFGEI